MKKVLSLVALVSLFFLVPVLVWGMQTSPFDKALVIDNRAGEPAENSGSNFYFKYAKSNPTFTSLEELDESIQEVKEYDTVFVSTEDGYALSGDQWNKVNMNIGQNAPSLLFAEYGVIHNSESGDLSNLISNDLGLHSTNWSGLYVSDLSDRDNPAIPERVFSNLADEWDYSGPGLVLNNSNEEKAIVVELDQQQENTGLGLVATEYGKEQGFEDLNAPYTGWFDIISPAEGTHTLYDFALNLSDGNEEVFKKYGIPENIPAVTVVRNGPSNRVYLAGTFSRSEAIPKIYQVKGIQRVYGAIERYSSNSFYWNSFFPLMDRILGLQQKFASAEGEEFADTAGEYTEEVSYSARIAEESDRIEVKIDGDFRELTIKGVNMGMASPGYFPGEAAITEEEYEEWFEQIGAMNSNTVRVYTLHPPEFYRALATYNAAHENKIYVLHGVWINEEWITGDADAFHQEAVEGFQKEIRHVVDALHGNAIIESLPGHSSGVYATDVSDFVIGWILGTEWDPFMVQGTNEKHPDVGEFDGEHYQTSNASPFEFWLASQMEYTTEYELDQYNEVRPMSFTNWVTTDILRHPSDNSNQEDISEVNPNNITTKGVMEEVGQFASYHIYPYYPDFLQMDQKYVNTTDHRGEPNTYYAYLEELRSVHSMPVLVAEFGIPTSRGRTHSGPMGMHQGGVTETDQGAYVQKMFEDILQADYMGGLVFTWQDEWFKRTWNTMELDNPDRRPYWSNAQTSEQQFGLLSFDSLKIKVDGEGKEWTTEPFYEASNDTDPIRKAYVDHDERYLYLKFDLSGSTGEGGYPVALIDTIPNQGNNVIGQYDVSSETAADFMVSLENDNARVMVDPYYDLHGYIYGYLFGYIEAPENVGQKNSGEFVPINYVLNQSLFNPETGETIPFEEYETGRLREGNGNPEAADYDSLADYAWSNDKKTVEVRIPWLLLSVRDPSTKEIAADFNVIDSIYGGEFIEDLGIGFLFVDDGQPVQTLPGRNPGSNQIAPLHRYTWENWTYFDTTPRLKQSYYHLQDYFSTFD